MATSGKVNRALACIIAVSTIASSGLLTASTAGATQKDSEKPPPSVAWGYDSETKAIPGEPERIAQEGIPEDERTKVLGRDYKTSEDLAIELIGDAEGLHLMAAPKSNGYEWQTIATLNEPGVQADQWIGNYCAFGASNKVAVVYAPRTYTNTPSLMGRGGFSAIVDVESGHVSKLELRSTLAYFSPSCSVDGRAVFTAYSDESPDTGISTRVTVVDESAIQTDEFTLVGQYTSATPSGREIVAANGHSVVRITKDGSETIAKTTGTPFRIASGPRGEVTFIDPDMRGDSGARGQNAAVRRISAQSIKTHAKSVATEALFTGQLKKFDLVRAANGKVAVLGDAEQQRPRLPSDVLQLPESTHGGSLSSDGEAVVHTRVPNVRTNAAAGAVDHRVRTILELRVVQSGFQTNLTAAPEATIDVDSGNSPSFEKGTAGSESRQNASKVDSGSMDPYRVCSVPRNDVKQQAYQPTPRQIEWAVDQAVVGSLNDEASRSTNWKNTGMDSYAPQEMFPLPELAGGSGEDWHIPAQVLLGVVAQESNMWQATRYAVPGASANPLIGNYYGIDYHQSGEQEDPFAISWPDADCGYGLTQVTDGMRRPGNGQPSLPYEKQQAVALDYAANIAAGAQILADKWNQTHADGLIINDGDPSHVENWFYALWAYNSGYYPEDSADDNAGKWGVGWTNNPANPIWLANRPPFLQGLDFGDDYSHAAHPQDWPYPEKVIGWAARPISAMFAPGDFRPGYRPAWWLTEVDRVHAMPPIDAFCDESNNCDASMIDEDDANAPGLGACGLTQPGTDTYFKCWFHKPVEWKDCGAAAECGFALHRFNTTYPEQPDGHGYPPRCNSGLPSGALIVDDVAAGVTPTGSEDRSCGPISSAGTFSLDFGSEPNRVDFHQIGGGYGNHFWFTHTYLEGTPNAQRMDVRGTWTLESQRRGWMRVWTHIPDHGAHTRQAVYDVIGTDSTSPSRAKPQRVRDNKWVSLGVFNFTGQPSVSLSNISSQSGDDPAVNIDGNGTEDIAWDAVAFEPLQSKPEVQAVAMGDSYTSGEGVTSGSNDDYYVETDYENERNEYTRNACHRSREAWPRLATLPGMAASVGQLDDAMSPSVDFQFVACSGARHYNVLRGGQYGELGQIDQGYLDQHTDIVALSIGGNDMRFGDVLSWCVLATNCYDTPIISVDPDTGKDLPDEDTGELGVWAPVWAREVVRPRIVETLKAIQAEAPNATIYLMGYPHLISDPCLPGIGAMETNWFKNVADVLATEMSSAVADAQAQGVAASFMDPRAAFEGVGACGDPEAISGFVYSNFSSADNSGGLPSMKSFHPNLGGAEIYSHVFESAM